jgi:hypothetical protein
MEPYIPAKMKGIDPAIGTAIPGFGDTWLNTQAVIQLHQSVEYLVDGPDNGLVPCICRVKGRDPFRFIVPEDIIILSFACRAGSENKGRYDKGNEPHAELRLKLKL